MRTSQFLTRLAAMAGIGLLAFAPQSSANAQTFDFEELVPGVGTPIISTQGGLTVTITRIGGGSLMIFNFTSPTPITGNSIWPFDGNAGGTMLINFSAPVNSVSINAGDFNQDDDSPITLTAFSSANAGGANLGSDAVNYAGDQDVSLGQFASLSVAAPGILSVTLTNGGAFPGFLGYDNLVVTQNGVAAAPEPASAAFLLPLIGLAALRRRK